MGKLVLSDEERRRRSENMKRLHEEGRAGAAFGKLGGRPRIPRATERLAEAAAEDADDIIQVYRDGIAPEQPIGVRMAAADSYAKHDKTAQQMAIQQERLDIDLDKADREDVLEFLVNALTSGTLSTEILPIIDTTGEDIEPAAIEGRGRVETNGASGQAVSDRT